VTYDGSGVRFLNTAEYVPNFAGLAGTASASNVRMNASTDLNTASGTTVNALVVVTGTTLSNSQGGGLTVTSGLVVSEPSPGAALINVPLNVGSAEAILLGNITLNAPLSGTGGLTAGHQGTLRLNVANTYNGPTTINGGTILFFSPDALGGSTRIIAGGTLGNSDGDVGRATLQYMGTSPATLTQSLQLQSGLLTVGSNALTPSAPLTLAGPISGPGGFRVFTISDVSLTNLDNSYTGATEVRQGSVRFSDDRQLGNGGPLELQTAGGIVLDGNWTTSRTVNLVSAQFNTHGWDAVLNGPLTGSGGSLTKTGAGTLTLRSLDNSFTGSLSIGPGVGWI
jgi:autotransporter-associated beta strand protein